MKQKLATAWLAFVSLAFWLFFAFVFLRALWVTMGWYGFAFAVFIVVTLWALCVEKRF